MSVSVDKASLRLLFDNLPVGIGVAEPVEPDGTMPPEGRVLYCNKQWVRMFGFDAKQVRTVAEVTRRLYPDPVLREEMLRRRYEVTERQQRGEEGEQMEARAMGADGQWLDVITGTAVVNNRLIVSMLDITARKQAEDALAEALRAETAAHAAAERATRAKSLFMANVSHEIRTPLTSLIALAQAMWLESEKLDLPPEFAAFLGRVRSGGNYLNLILTNLLDISAAEFGKLPVCDDTFYVRDWGGDLENILEPVARSHDVKLVWRWPEDDEVRFRTDQLRLTQILLNLSHNAIKFSGREGRTVTVSIMMNGANLELVVEDEGPGVPPERLSGLFGEFAQSEVQGSCLDRGVGLGLAVVKQNADLVGGRIWAENRQPHGMRFTVSLPPLTSSSTPSPSCEP